MNGESGEDDGPGSVDDPLAGPRLKTRIREGRGGRLGGGLWIEYHNTSFGKSPK